MHLHDAASAARRAAEPIDNIFINRWSPRAMTGEPVSDPELRQLLEAARWAPSSYNEQPWRFLYAHRDTPDWPVFFDLLVPANQAWASQAGALLLVASRQRFAANEKPNPVHVYDAGAAWQNLALQGAALGLVVHGMAGFDQDRARTALRVPDAFTICAMAAVGRLAEPDVLPQELRDKEKPSDRKPIDDFAFQGGFPA